MKKVEFVRIKSELIGYGLGKGTKYGFDRVEEIIKERIENGWDYCGYVPTKISDVINVKVVKEVETSDLIKMDETEIACILEKNEF